MAQPFVLKGARETNQAHKGADCHGDPAQCKQSPETPAPEIFPRKSGEGQLGGHEVGVSPHVFGLGERSERASLPGGKSNVHPFYEIRENYGFVQPLRQLRTGTAKGLLVLPWLPFF